MPDNGASDNRILGTRVPDNALHRASLWVEDLKGTRDGQVKSAEDIGADLEILARACEVSITGAELEDGARFYAQNFLEMFGAGRFQIHLQTPAGPVDLATMFLSIWVDGLEHGAAMVAGKRGLSNAELRDE